MVKKRREEIVRSKGLKKGEKIFKVEGVGKRGRKIKRLLITKAPLSKVSKVLTKRAILRGITNIKISRIEVSFARKLVLKSKVKLKRIRRLNIRGFKSRSRAI